MQGVFVILFFFIVVGIPVIAGVLGEAHKRHLKFKERQLEAFSSETAEKAAQYAPTPSGWSSGCGCWSGSSPTRASSLPKRSNVCGTSRSINSAHG